MKEKELDNTDIRVKKSFVKKEWLTLQTPHNAVLCVLFSISDDLIKVHKMKPTQKWRQQFDSYLKTMPIYYAQVGVLNTFPSVSDYQNTCFYKPNLPLDLSTVI